jgi:hypothetical protein
MRHRHPSQHSTTHKKSPATLPGFSSFEKKKLNLRRFFWRVLLPAAGLTLWARLSRNRLLRLLDGWRLVLWVVSRRANFAIELFSSFPKLVHTLAQSFEELRNLLCAEQNQHNQKDNDEIWTAEVSKSKGKNIHTIPLSAGQAGTLLF